MLALYLLAAHMLGDFVFANRWQAERKLFDREIRSQHVIAYVLPFAPILIWQGFEVGALRAVIAWLVLFSSHFLTDSRRFRSTLGDVVQWRLDARREPLEVKRAWIDYVYEGHFGHGFQAADVSDEAVVWPTPNPWPAAPLLIDQALHVAQLAVVGAILVA